MQRHSHRLLLHRNLASLKSLSIKDANGTDLNLLLETMGEETVGRTWDGLERYTF